MLAFNPIINQWLWVIHYVEWCTNKKHVLNLFFINCINIATETYYHSCTCVRSTNRLQFLSPDCLLSGLWMSRVFKWYVVSSFLNSIISMFMSTAIIMSSGTGMNILVNDILHMYIELSIIYILYNDSLSNADICIYSIYSLTLRLRLHKAHS